MKPSLASQKHCLLGDTSVLANVAYGSFLKRWWGGEVGVLGNSESQGGDGCEHQDWPGLSCSGATAREVVMEKMQ